MADQLKLAVEGWLAEMPENEFRALYARVRPPTEPIATAIERGH